MSSDIEEIKREIDIVDVVSEYVSLERVGSNYRANCPFHPDRTPSFYVSPSKQIFKCFGCGVGGDAIKFVALMENLSYLEAALELSRKVGKPLNLSKLSRQEKTLIALDRVTDFYESNLSKSREATEYLKSRGIDGRTARRFSLGFSPSTGELVRFLKREGLLEEYLKTRNLLDLGNGNYKDLFLKRLVIPVRNPSGRTVGFGGRRLREDSSPKYINSPESELFQKRKNLFGLSETRDYIRDAGHAILVEGYFDLLRLFSENLRNVVAPLGTALTQEQAKLLSRYAGRVYLLYDGDKAGREAMKKAIPHLLSAGLEVYPVYLPEGYDPDSFISEFGPKELKKLIENSEELFSSLIRKGRENLEEAAREFRYYLSFVADDVKRIALATEFYRKNRFPLELLLTPPRVKGEEEIKLSFKEKILLKGLLLFRPPINPEDLRVSEKVRKLCEKALRGEEHELPKEVLEYESESLERLFGSVLGEFLPQEALKSQ